jgi:very-short-patch-repair endonuclease
MKRLNNLPKFKERRAELRHNQTIQEARLWNELRKHKLGFKFKRQHSVGPYILDFYCPGKKLAVELDGAYHLGNKEYDAERSGYLSALGIKVHRFWNNRVDDNIGAVVEMIKQELGLRPAKGEVSRLGGTEGVD